MMGPGTSNGTGRRDSEAREEASDPRILMPTARRFRKKAWLAGQYEAQDVLAEVDSVDLICLEPGKRYETRELWQRRLMYHDISQKVVYLNPGLNRVRLTRDYDLFVARCQTYKDFLDINAIQGWKDHCKTSVCWIDEMWTASIPQHRYWIRALRQFDHVFVGFAGTAKPLSEIIEKPCHYLPGAVDTLRFTPARSAPARVIDIYSVGRRHEGMHRAFLNAASQRDLLYIYDTFSGSQAEPYDHREHRDHFANLVKRSRYFVVAPGKFDCPEETQGQMEVGHRYFEGAAAGAVMVGQAPKCDAFGELFPWPDAVVEMRPDGSDAIELLEQFDSNPERLGEISRKNTEQALLRHDWVHRWEQVLRVAGLEPSQKMRNRKRRLEDLARQAAGADSNFTVAAKLG